MRMKRPRNLKKVRLNKKMRRWLALPSRLDLASKESPSEVDLNKLIEESPLLKSLPT